MKKAIASLIIGLPISIIAYCLSYGYFHNDGMLGSLSKGRTKLRKPAW